MQVLMVLANVWFAQLEEIKDVIKLKQLVLVDGWCSMTQLCSVG